MMETVSRVDLNGKRIYTVSAHFRNILFADLSEDTQDYSLHSMTSSLATAKINLTRQSISKFGITKYKSKFIELTLMTSILTAITDEKDPNQIDFVIGPSYNIGKGSDVEIPKISDSDSLLERIVAVRLRIAIVKYGRGESVSTSESHIEDEFANLWPGCVAYTLFPDAIPVFIRFLKNIKNK